MLTTMVTPQRVPTMGKVPSAAWGIPHRNELSWIHGTTDDRIGPSAILSHTC